MHTIKMKAYKNYNPFKHSWYVCQELKNLTNYLIEQLINRILIQLEN